MRRFRTEALRERRGGFCEGTRRALLMCALASGCAADFTEPWEVIEPRLMGARVEVEGDATRTRPRLTERFSLRQYIAPPGPSETPLASRYGMDLAICLGVRTPTGELVCVGEQNLDPTVTVVSDTEVLLGGLGLDLSSLPTNLPELPMGTDPAMLAELAELDRMVLFGVLCVDGRAERVLERPVQDSPPSQLFRCVDNQSARFPAASTFTISVLLDRGRPFDGNRNPSFACDPAAPDSACTLGVVRDGEPRVPGSFVIARPKQPNVPGREVLAWPARDPALPLPWVGCASDETIPKVAAGSDEHTLRARFDPADREQYQYEMESNGVPVLRSDREALTLSHALTEHGGELSRFDSRLRPDEVDGAAEISFAYRPPKQSDDPAKNIPVVGKLVRFYFTLRDERGGVDFTTRELCLVPAPQRG